MEVDFIFILKENDNTNTSIHKQVEDMLCKIFDTAELDSIEVFDRKGNICSVDIELSQEENHIVYLKLVCNETEARSADVLDSLSTKITNGYHRKDFIITKTYDEASHSYCCRIMAQFGMFERRLRELIYLTIIKMFGAKWFDQTFEKNLQNELKGKPINKSQLIERALEELTYEQLKTYLFSPIRLLSPTDLVDINLSEEKINNLSKKEIVDIVNSSRPIKLWEHFFKKYQTLMSMEADINYLQEYRNKVMHHKTFTYEDFTNTKKRLRSVNSRLKRAIDHIESRIYCESDYINVAQTIAQSIMDVIHNVVESIELKTLLQTAADFLNSYKILSDSMKTLPTANYNIATPLLGLQNVANNIRIDASLPNATYPPTNPPTPKNGAASFLTQLQITTNNSNQLQVQVTPNNSNS